MAAESDVPGSTNHRKVGRSAFLIAGGLQPRLGSIRRRDQRRRDPLLRHRRLFEALGGRWWHRADVTQDLRSRIHQSSILRPDERTIFSKWWGALLSVRNFASGDVPGAIPTPATPGGGRRKDETLSPHASPTRDAFPVRHRCRAASRTVASKQSILPQQAA